MESIRRAMETASAHLIEHPEAGVTRDAPATAFRDGELRFRVEGPGAPVVSDMPSELGGGAGAPTPGWLLRAALASCDATAVAMEAVRAGIDLTELRVTVESDSDHRGLLGVGDAVAPGPLAVRVRVELAAPGVEPERLRALVERAEALSPVNDALACEVAVTTEIVAG